MPDELRQIGFQELDMYLKHSKDQSKERWQQSLVIANHLRPEDADPLEYEDLVTRNQKEKRTTKEKLNDREDLSSWMERVNKARNKNDGS